MSSHLIYHPPRVRQTFGQTVVHYDRTSGNQDPFVWNRSFLHTYCHMPQLRDPQPGDINFWVSSAKLQGFSNLLCDLVFLVSERRQWRDRNCIEQSDPIVDNEISYRDHYRWAERQHSFKRRHRKTLKADPAGSFQPQAADGSLLDIVPVLTRAGYTLPLLHSGLISGYQSKPMPIPRADAKSLYVAIQQMASIQIHGAELQRIREQHPNLQSPW
jgi:hypothetical protein